MDKLKPEVSDESEKGTLGRDFMASIVVFLVALPLCMGIAIASGVPPALGLITGMVGGLIVGFLAGQPLQVSGPAAGLAVMVWQLVHDYGLEALGLAVLICGAIQLIAGFAGLGRWFRAVAPPVILGMLAGIGALIFASQFHVMVDDKPRGNGLDNLLSIPEAIYKGVFPLDGSVHHMAAAIGLLTIVSIVLWNRFRPKVVKMLPGPLIGVVLATAAAGILDLPIAYVSVPENLLDSFNWVTSDSLSLLSDFSYWAEAVGLAVIASAETLLCATAVDRIHDGERTKYNKELRAQGIGNIICGVFGALPMTGVIVRSSANVEAGGKTKWSAIMHGAWILLLVAFLPQVLALIPTSSLAAILVYTGYKLFGIPSVIALGKKGYSHVLVWAVTVGTIVATDLLTGVAVGFGLTLVRLLFAFARLDVKVEEKDGLYNIKLFGAATFISLPKLAEALEALPPKAEVHFYFDHLQYVDHACMECIEDWRKRHDGKVFLEFHRLEERSDPKAIKTPA